MSTTGASAQGTVYLLDDHQEVQARGDDSAAPPQIRRGADKPGVTNLIEIRPTVQPRP